MSHLYCVFRPPTVISLIFAGEQRPQKKGKCYFGIWVKNINGEEALLRWRWRIIWTWIAVIKPIRTVTREHAELFSEHMAARSVFCKNSLLIGLCYLLFTQTSSLDIQVFSILQIRNHPLSISDGLSSKVKAPQSCNGTINYTIIPFLLKREVMS